MEKKKHRPTSEEYPALPVWELRGYISVHIGIVIFICYSVYQASNKHVGILNSYDFQPGWWIFGRTKDVSNYEWDFYYKFFWKVWPFIIGHIATSKLSQWYFNKHRKQLMVVYFLLALIGLMGWCMVALFVGHCLLMYVTSFLQSVAAVWIVSLGLLSTLNLEPFISWMTLLNTDSEEEKSFFYLLMFTLAYLQLRYTSFCVDRVEFNRDLQNKGDNFCTKDENSSKQQNIRLQFNLIDMFFYVFYLPLFFTGPVISYKIFSAQLHQPAKPWSRGRIISLMLDFVRFTFWAFLNEVILHFFYFNAMQNDLKVLKIIDLWTLAGIGYWSGQFFMTKYTVMFGLPSCIARIDELDPPKGPKCVAHVYLYSDMWKYFDRGMYDFIRRYIYFPIGGSRHGTSRQILSVMACFVFVYYWHGVEYYVFLWTLFNFLGICLEATGTYISRLSAVKSIERRYLSPAWVRRIHALIILPLFILSAFTAFCFFGGSAVGYTFYERFIYKGSPDVLLLVVAFLYCCIQVGMEVKRHEYNKPVAEN